MKLVESFSEDLLGLSAFANQIEAFIAVEREYVSGSLVVSLDGRFGYGKTTFLRMWKASIEARTEEGQPKVVLLNAWDNDFLGDPLSAIVSSLEKSLGSDAPGVGGVVRAAKDMGRFALALGGQYVAKVTGFDFEAAGEYARGLQDVGGASVSSDAYSAYKAREAAIEKLRDAIGRLANANTGGVIVFVDELDRCRPDYAISYLETIKHVFDAAGLTFILAVDRSQLQSVAKAAFGDGLDFSEYYRKFVQREVSLPAISEEGYHKLASAYVAAFMEPDGKRASRFKLDHVQNFRLVDFFTKLRLTPRQLQELFRILGHCGAIESKQDRGRTRGVYTIGAAVMASLKVGAVATYHAIGRGELAPIAAKEFAVRHSSDFAWLVALFFTGGGLAVPDQMTDAEFVRLTGLASDDRPESISSAIDQNWIDWDREAKPLHSIYCTIEQVAKFR